MAQLAPIPGTGINRLTGKPLAGWFHVIQCLGVIFTTNFGERPMRRWFGSDIPVMLGRNLVESTVLNFWSAICIAIYIWEPRFRVIKITPFAGDLEMRAGKIGFKVAGIYFPRGHLGDRTPGDIAAFSIGGDPTQLIIKEINP